MNNLEKVKFMLRKKKLQQPKKIKKGKLPKTFYCETCDKHYTKNNKQFHYDTNFHKNNLVNNKGTRSNE